MKKQSLAKLALLGIGAALTLGGCQSTNDNNNKAAADEQVTPDMQAFYNSLSPQAKEKFMQLDAQHRMMAVQAPQGQCADKNTTCGGKDPNKVVEFQYNNQMQQRQSTNNGMQGAGN